jgi:hypothetical protein
MYLLGLQPGLQPGRLKVFNLLEGQRGASGPQEHERSAVAARAWGDGELQRLHSRTLSLMSQGLASRGQWRGEGGGVGGDAACGDDVSERAPAVLVSEGLNSLLHREHILSNQLNSLLLLSFRTHSTLARILSLAAS